MESVLASFFLAEALKKLWRVPCFFSWLEAGLSDDELIVLENESDRRCSYSIMVWTGHLRVVSVLEIGTKRLWLQVSLLRDFGLLSKVCFDRLILGIKPGQSWLEIDAIVTAGRSIP